MISRAKLRAQLEPYRDTAEVQQALEILAESASSQISNTDVRRIWDRLSVAIDHVGSEDDNHPIHSIETELSQAYQYE